jgi:hypothetical protein
MIKDAFDLFTIIMLLTAILSAISAILQWKNVLEFIDDNVEVKIIILYLSLKC